MIATSVDMAEILRTGVVPSGVKLLREDKAFEILEAKNIDVKNNRGEMVKRCRLTGVFQKADAFNENKRRYNIDIIKEALGAIQELVVKRRVLGECDHPQDAKIHLDRVSHLVTKLWLDDKKVYGELEVLTEMPCGKILKALVDAEVVPCISSRGIGDMQPVTMEGSNDEGFEVLPGFRFVTWDIVAEPSVTEAQLSVLESKQHNMGDSRKNAEAEILKALHSALRV